MREQNPAPAGFLLSGVAEVTEVVEVKGVKRRFRVSGIRTRDQVKNGGERYLDD